MNRKLKEQHLSEIKKMYITVFKIDNNQKCLLSSKSSY